MKKALTLGGILVAIGTLITIIGFFSHHQPFDPFSRATVTQTHRQTLSKKHFNRVKVTAATAEITVKEGAHYRVQYAGQKPAAVKAQVKDGQLTVTQTPSVRAKHPHFIWSRGTDRITITVPRGSQLKGLTIKSNDDIDLHQLHLASGMVKTTAGDLTVNKCRLAGSSLTSDSGDIEVTNSQLTGTRVTNTSGDIDFDRVMVKGGKADIDSGDFSAHGLTVNGHYLVNNQSGDNEVDTSNQPGAILTSDSGDNELGNREQDEGGKLEHDLNNPDLIRLITQSGDNSFNS